MFSGADKLLFQKAGALRRQQTFAEELLWNYLRKNLLVLNSEGNILSQTTF
jgi:very-short-patch-repair endonuclease